MKTTYQGPVFTIEEEAPDLKGAFKFLANCEELFAETKCCKNCQGTNIVPKHRSNSGYEFFELECKDCKWRFKFGQRKDQEGLFPKGWEAPYESESQAPPPATKKKVAESLPF